MTVRGKELSPEQYAWLQQKLAGFERSPEQWISLLVSYGVPADRLTGDACACPVCGGDDRFTYDNKRGRGDWVCRKCDNGRAMAGDGLQLITRLNSIGLYRLMRQLDGGPAPRALNGALVAKAPSPKRKPAATFIANRLSSMWDSAKPVSSGDLAMRYLGARVPGLRMASSPALRLGMLEYRHEKKRIGSWPGILARFELPDGRLGTLHRTFLERSTPAKARIVSARWRDSRQQAERHDAQSSPGRRRAIDGACRRRDRGGGGAGNGLCCIYGVRCPNVVLPEYRTATSVCGAGWIGYPRCPYFRRL
ncbi:DUF7146 domain-containing protein [Paraburkholderia fungorum]|uniref:DUF7146 domain-containing protein n=1 Tax=Paraburkholderia fungorum TaxID=134537 RepID=UPI00402B3228